MSFHVGQLVKCIGSVPLAPTPSGFRTGYGNEQVPHKGVIYTVRDFFLSREFSAPAVLLIEVVNPERRYATPTGVATFEPYWSAKSFVPVDETRLEVFRKIAANPKIEVDA